MCDLGLNQILFMLAGHILGTISSVWVMRFGENRLTKVCLWVIV